MGSLLALVVTTGAGADEAPWDLTPEERLAARTEASRTAARETALDKTVTQDVESASWTRIRGATAPQALFPGELFSRLLTLAFAPDPEVRESLRQTLNETAIALGFGESFWPQLETCARAVLESRQRQIELAKQGRLAGADAASALKAKVADEGTNECRLRKDALERAYQLFGRERFLKLLYYGVAPSTNVISRNEDRAALIRAEEGCQ